MRIMAIIGSPRKQGNTEVLVDEVVKGAQSCGSIEVEKIVVSQKNIKNCTGCLSCSFPNSGTGTCVIIDDMAEILEHMKTSDAFIFGSPNHMGTITAPLLNFFSRMMPLFDFKVVRDDEGKIVSGEMSSKISGKKAAIVISQGDPFFSSSLAYMFLEKNLHDFRIARVGDVISRGNLRPKAVLEKKDDLQKAFELGVKLVSMEKK